MISILRFYKQNSIVFKAIFGPSGVLYMKDYAYAGKD